MCQRRLQAMVAKPASFCWGAGSLHRGLDVPAGREFAPLPVRHSFVPLQALVGTGEVGQLWGGGERGPVGQGDVLQPEALDPGQVLGRELVRSHILVLVGGEAGRVEEQEEAVLGPRALEPGEVVLGRILVHSHILIVVGEKGGRFEMAGRVEEAGLVEEHEEGAMEPRAVEPGEVVLGCAGFLLELPVVVGGEEGSVEKASLVEEQQGPAMGPRVLEPVFVLGCVRFLLGLSVVVGGEGGSVGGAGLVEEQEEAAMGPRVLEPAAVLGPVDEQAEAAIGPRVLEPAVVLGRARLPLDVLAVAGGEEGSVQRDDQWLSQHGDEAGPHCDSELSSLCVVLVRVPAGVLPVVAAYAGAGWDQGVGGQVVPGQTHAAFVLLPCIAPLRFVLLRAFLV